MFVFNRPLGAVAAGLAVALLVVCLDAVLSPVGTPIDASNWHKNTWTALLKKAGVTGTFTCHGADR